MTKDTSRVKRSDGNIEVDYRGGEYVADLSNVPASFPPHDVEKPIKKKRFVFMEYPFQVWFIMANELCERFSFYGFKTILPLYLTTKLGMTDNGATSVIHAFVCLAYFTPLFGGWLSDSKIGKFWTILWLSLVYCVGQILIAVTAAPGLEATAKAGLAVGLLLVAVGTGGIKPCVSSFGADQFDASQVKLISSFFAVFYLSINAGSTVSTFASPEIRDAFDYYVAFAVPAVLLLLATIVFAIGKRWYKINPPGGNVARVLTGVVSVAVKDFIKNRENKKEGFLDRAESRYSKQTISDVRQTLAIIYCLWPVIIFWSLYDQNSTRWVFQAERMDLSFGAAGTLSADQIQTLNPLLLILLIPVFDRVIYPAIAKCGFNFTPLRRIGVGFVLTSVSFVASGVLELFMNEVHYKIHWAAQVPQYFILAVAEILVAITCLEFAYNQAPSYMKSIMTAFYLLTVAFGNVIVVIVAETSVMPRMWEYFFFACLMGLFTFIYVLIARRYKYIVDKEEKDEAKIEEGSQSSGSDENTDHDRSFELKTNEGETNVKIA